MAALTDTKICVQKPRPNYGVAGMEGLCLDIRPTGARAWRYRYRYLGKANMLHLGDYPAMSLQDPRRQRDRQREKAKWLFESYAYPWIGKRRLVVA